MRRVGLEPTTLRLKRPSRIRSKPQEILLVTGTSGAVRVHNSIETRRNGHSNVCPRPRAAHDADRRCILLVTFRSRSPPRLVDRWLPLVDPVRPFSGMIPVLQRSSEPMIRANQRSTSRASQSGRRANGRAFRCQVSSLRPGGRASDRATNPLQAPANDRGTPDNPAVAPFVHVMNPAVAR